MSYIDLYDNRPFYIRHELDIILPLEIKQTKLLFLKHHWKILTITLLVLVVSLSLIYIKTTPIKVSNTSRGGILLRNETWGGEIKIDKQVVVPPTVKLKIEPGTVVKFKHWRFGYSEEPERLAITVLGELEASGTAEKPIRFTSDADKPEHGDWDGVGAKGTLSHLKLDHVIVEFAWASISGEGTHDAVITNSIVRWVTGGGLFFSDKSSGVILFKNRFYQNGHNNIEVEGTSKAEIKRNYIWGAGNGGIFIGDNSQVVIEGNLIEKNSDNGIAFESNGGGQVINNRIKDNGTQAILIAENAGEVAVQEEADFSEPTFDFENNETYPHVPGGPNDTYLYIFPDDETRNIVGSYSWSESTGIAWDGQNLWIVENKLGKRSLSGKLISSFASPAIWGWGLAWDEKSLWMSDHSASKILQVGTNGREISSFSTPCLIPMGIEFDGENLWFSCEMGEGKLYYANRTGKILKTLRGMPEAHGLAWDGRFLWLANNGADKIFKVDSTDGKILGWIRTPGDRTFDCAWVTEGSGRYLWCADWTDETDPEMAKIFKMKVLTTNR